MLNQILADYYEEKEFVTKSLRLRKRNSLVIFGWYNQYTYNLGAYYSYGNYQGNACWFNSIYIYKKSLSHGCGASYWVSHGFKNYHSGNAWFYR